MKIDVILVRVRISEHKKKAKLSLLLKAGGNWNNALQAGPGYRNGNNSTSNSNRNNGAHVELRFVIKKTSLNSILTRVLEWILILKPKMMPINKRVLVINHKLDL